MSIWEGALFQEYKVVALTLDTRTGKATPILNQGRYSAVYMFPSIGWYTSSHNYYLLRLTLLVKPVKTCFLLSACCVAIPCNDYNALLLLNIEHLLPLVEANDDNATIDSLRALGTAVKTQHHQPGCADQLSSHTSIPSTSNPLYRSEHPDI